MKVKKVLFDKKGAAFLILLGIFFGVGNFGRAGPSPRPAGGGKSPLLEAATRTRMEQALDAVRNQLSADAVIKTGKGTGLPSLIRSKKGGLPTRISAGARDLPETAGGIYLREYKDLFGMKDPDQEMQVYRVQKKDRLGTKQVRYRQYHRGVPVVGAELIVQLDRNNGLNLFAGRYRPDLTIDVNPFYNAAQALEKAKEAIHRERETTAPELTEPELKILDERFLNRGGEKVFLVWETAAKGRSKKGGMFREKVYVDAQTGGVVFRHSLIHRSLDRAIYDGEGGDTLPGNPVLREGGATGGLDSAVVDAYSYADETYDYFLDVHGRDGMDDAGMTIGVTVHYDDGIRSYSGATGCGNALYFPEEELMVFCENMLGLDIFAHEYTHGVTVNTANLYVAFEPGALNESYSDVFGSALGESWVLGAGLDYPTPLRSMSNPPLYYQPDKVSSDYFYCSNTAEEATDYGGIHINSGVPNKAAWLMAEGGTFNGYSVHGIGRDKMGLIHYRALTTKLSPFSDFADNYDALIASCEELIGSDGITDDNCTQVEKALKAVEMDQEVCAGGETEDSTPEGEEGSAGTEAESPTVGCSLFRPLI